MTTDDKKLDVDVLAELAEVCEDIRVASEECDIGEGLFYAVPFHMWGEFLAKLDAAENHLARLKGESA